MLLDFHSVSSAESAGYQETANNGLRERLVTAAVASLAVLIVAAIAVLLGMA